MVTPTNEVQPVPALIGLAMLPLSAEVPGGLEPRCKTVALLPGGCVLPKPRIGREVGSPGL